MGVCLDSTYTRRLQKKTICSTCIYTRLVQPSWSGQQRSCHVFCFLSLLSNNRPRSIYQYSNMAPRLSGQTSIFGVVSFVSKSLMGIEGQKKLEKFAILTRKPRSHA